MIKKVLNYDWIYNLIICVLYFFLKLFEINLFWECIYIWIKLKCEDYCFMYYSVNEGLLII